MTENEENKPLISRRSVEKILTGMILASLASAVGAYYDVQKLKDDMKAVQAESKGNQRLLCGFAIHLTKKEEDRKVAKEICASHRR